MAEFVRTKAIAAARLEVSRVALTEWSTHPEFPNREKLGWNVDAIREFAKKHGKGPYRRGGGKQTNIGGVTLTEANIRRTIEQAENERIKKEMLLVEQAESLGELLSFEDVSELYRQTVATVTAVHDSLVDAVDRAMPDVCPTQESWPGIRVKVMELCGRLTADAAAVIKELKV